jgi:hypothetical protein
MLLNGPAKAGPYSVSGAQEQAAPGPAPAAVAYAQGRVIVAMTDLLRRGEAGPVPVKARTPLATTYAGTDAALLQVQAEAIALALEAFGAAPVQPRAAAPATTR